MIVATVDIFLTLDSFFFFNNPATTEIYTLSLHDALPISIYIDDIQWIDPISSKIISRTLNKFPDAPLMKLVQRDRKSTRLNSSHVKISYAVFCLKKKTK